MELKATAGRLIAKVNKDETKTKSGILLSTPQNKDLKNATVVSVGDRLKDVTQNFHEGDTIYYGNYQGVEFTGDDGEKYIILNQSDVIAYTPIFSSDKAINISDTTKGE